MWFRRVCLCLFVVALAATEVGAQISVRGVIVDRSTGETLPGATVLVLDADSTQAGVASGPDGAFDLSLADGLYQFRVSFIGFVPAERALTVAGAPIDLGRIEIRPDTTLLGDAVVEAIQTRVEIRGDTTAFNADAYTLNPEASAGDLVRRLPGVTEQDGTVRANGEDVQRVLVDGKEFFGDDPATALEALPAAAIKEIQVYDRASDQEELTGFDDGERQQTINLVTRPERRTSTFGDVLLAGGTGRHFVADGTLNRFDGDRRATVLIQSDNLDFRTSAAIRGERGRRQIGSFGFDGLSQSGSASASVNDTWGDWAEVSATYRLNGSDGSRDNQLTREYLATEAVGQRYDQDTDASRFERGQSLSGRAEITLSERTELRISPRLNWEANSTEDLLQAGTRDPADVLLSQTRTASTGESGRLGANLEVSGGHKFETEGRSLALQLRASAGRDDSDREQQIQRLVRSLAGDPEIDAFGRQIDEDERESRVRASITATEPIVQDLQVMVGYKAEVSARDADQIGLRQSDAGAFTIPDDAFTSVTDQRIVTHAGMAALQRQGDRLTLTAGVGLEHERVTFDQTGPRAFEIDRSAVTLQPYGRAQLKVGTAGQASLFYSVSTDIPDAQQLRDVIDDSNPLRITGGNPDLTTERTHRVSLGYRTADPAAGTSFSINSSVRFELDGVTQATSFAGSDSTTVRGVRLAPGAQFSFPVNLDGGIWSFAFLSYGRPAGGIGNLNLFGNLGYNRSPSLRDGVQTLRESLSGSASVTLATTGSETLDLSATYRLSGRVELGAFSTAPSTLTQGINTEVDWRPGRGVVTEGKFRLSYTPNQEREPVSTRLDLGVGLTFLANDRAKALLVMSDVLGQNASFDRSVTDLYIENEETLVLGRVVMLSLSYRIRQQGGGEGPPSGRGVLGPRRR